ncbi:MAG: DUF1015 family protein [Frankiaceae bacterium]
MPTETVLGPASRPPAPPGLVLAPFRGLRFDVPDVGSLTSPPYDVIDEPERAMLEASHPHNIVRLILPRDAAGQPGSRYEQAAATLRAWRGDGVLRRDPTPAIYLYEEVAGGHIQRGLLGAVALADASAEIILPHENTMAGPVADRLALMAATATNLEPIFLLYEGGGAASQVADRTEEAKLLIDTVVSDGANEERHRVWAVTDPDTLREVAADLLPRRVVIADGHHRYATYLRYQRDQHLAGRGPGAWDQGLSLLVDARHFGPRVHPVHRVLPQLPVAVAADRARRGFAVKATSASLEAMLKELADAPPGPSFVLTDGVSAFLLTRMRQDVIDPLLPRVPSATRELDVTVLHAGLVQGLWRLADNESVVDYRHDAVSAVQAARQTGGTAVLLNPTPAARVAAVAAAGERMPRKSTLFTPKPRSGLVLRPIE